MIYTKTNPIGVDYYIEKANQKIYDALNPLFSNGIVGFGKCNINKTNIEGVYSEVPEYTDIYNQNINVLTNDESKYFFTIGNNLKAKDNFQYIITLNVYFILNLDKVIGVDSQTSDTYIQSLVHKILSSSGFGKLDLEIGVNTVYKDFKLSKDSSSYFDDIRPKHVFKFTTKELVIDIRQKLKL